MVLDLISTSTKAHKVSAELIAQNYKKECVFQMNQAFTKTENLESELRMLFSAKSIPHMKITTNGKILRSHHIAES